MSQKTKCILVVDNDPAVSQLVTDVFRTSEFQIIEARDGVEALKQIDTSGASIDVLLVNVGVPRLKGAELARVIIAHHPTIKIIFMSERPDDVVNRHGIPHLKKPFTPVVLEQTVRDALKR